MQFSDSDRFETLITPHLEALFSAAYRLHRDRVDAEDLVQDVCLRAYDRFEQFAAATAPRAWLLRVQYNLYVDGVRRSARTPTEALDEKTHLALSEYADDPGPVAEAEAEELAGRLSVAWRSLTSDQQALLALQTEGYTLAELSAITTLPVGALKARLHRARVRLGKLVGINSSEPQLAVQAGEPK